MNDLSIEQLTDVIRRANEALDNLRSSKRESAVSEIQRLADEAGLIVKIEDRKKAPTTTGKVPPKFFDPASGKTWSGRGIRPAWVSESMRIAP